MIVDKLIAEIVSFRQLDRPSIICLVFVTGTDLHIWFLVYPFFRLSCSEFDLRISCPTSMVDYGVAFIIL